MAQMAVESRKILPRANFCDFREVLFSSETLAGEQRRRGAGDCSDDGTDGTYA
jgi:hypothetical protein